MLFKAPLSQCLGKGSWTSTAAQQQCPFSPFFFLHKFDILILPILSGAVLHITRCTQSYTNWSRYTAWCVITSTHGRLQQSNILRRLTAAEPPGNHFGLWICRAGRIANTQSCSNNVCSAVANLTGGEASNSAKSISLCLLNHPRHNQQQGVGK